MTMFHKRKQIEWNQRFDRNNFMTMFHNRKQIEWNKFNHLSKVRSTTQCSTKGRNFSCLTPLDNLFDVISVRSRELIISEVDILCSTLNSQDIHSCYILYFTEKHHPLHVHTKSERGICGYSKFYIMVVGIFCTIARASQLTWSLQYNANY